MDNLGEDIVVTGLAIGIGLGIGGSILAYRRWRDKSNALDDKTEEMKYIELSQQQKRDGWGFQKRYDFLKDAGFRKKNIDDILGKAERFEQTEISNEDFEEEYNKILDTTDNADRDEFLMKTYACYRDGMLSHLTLNLIEEARAKRIQQYVNLYKNICGDAIEFCMSQRAFEEDEILVAVDKEWFFLSNKAIYFFRKKAQYSLTKIVKLEEISEYTLTGWWSFRLDIKFSNGEIFTLKSQEKAPSEEVVNALLGGPSK